MLELAKTPQEMMGVNEEDLEKTIYPVGFYKNKAGQIIELSKLIVEKYNGILIPAHAFTPHKSYYGNCTSSLKRIFKEKSKKKIGAK